MKKVYVIIFVAISAACTNTEKKELDLDMFVPSKVITAFNMKFTHAQKVQFSKESEDEWEVEFVQNERAYSANFDSSGTWLETEFELTKSEIPNRILQTIQEEFNNATIEEIEYVEKPNIKAFELTLKTSLNEEIEVVINDEGVVIESEIKSSANNED